MIQIFTKSSLKRSTDTIIYNIKLIIGIINDNINPTLYYFYFISIYLFNISVISILSFLSLYA